MACKGSLARHVIALQAAKREFKRLRRSNEQSPGYAMSRAYLETLAELPWSALAGQRAALPAEASGSADAADGDGGPDKEDVSTGAAAGSEPGTIGEDGDSTEAPASMPSMPAGARQRPFCSAGSHEPYETSHQCKCTYEGVASFAV